MQNCLTDEGGCTFQEKHDWLVTAGRAKTKQMVGVLATRELMLDDCFPAAFKVNMSSN